MTSALELVDRIYGGTDEYNIVSREAADLLRKQHEALKVALDALEETTALCINYESVEEKDGYEFTEAKIVIPMGNAAIKQIKELL